MVWKPNFKRVVKSIIELQRTGFKYFLFWDWKYKSVVFEEYVPTESRICGKKIFIGFIIFILKSHVK